MSRDWRKWHRGYDEPGSLLQRRLAVVQLCVRDALDEMPPGRIRVISMCAGEGRDLLGVLEDHPRAQDVDGRLVELDPELAATASTAAPANVEVHCGDASMTGAYAEAVPANVLMLCGIFGNVIDADVEHTVRALPSLCAPGATVIWTRHRRPPDLTVGIRRWFEESGFEEVAFVAPDDSFYGVGMHRLTGATLPFMPDARLFSFVGYDALR
jgi:hypothetical protein